MVGEGRNVWMKEYMSQRRRENTVGGLGMCPGRVLVQFLHSDFDLGLAGDAPQAALSQGGGSIPKVGGEESCASNQSPEPSPISSWDPPLRPC